MKLLLNLLCVFVVIVSAVADNSTDDGATTCTIKIEEGETVFDKLAEKVEFCLLDMMTTHLMLFGHVNGTAEQLSIVFNKYCADIPSFSQCLDSSSSDVDVCLSEIQKTQFRLWRSYQEVKFHVGCDKNATHLVQLYQNSTHNAVKETNLCKVNATLQVAAPVSNDPNGRMIFEYQVLEKTLVCINEHKQEENDSLLDSMVSTFTKIMDRMKCIQDGVEVLCKTIVGTH